MRSKFLIVITLLALAGISSGAHAQMASSKSITEMLRLSGTVDVDRNARLKLLPALQQIAPDMSESFWQEFINKSDNGELMALTVEVYQQHLTQVDVDAIIAFYKSASGANLINSQSLIVQESTAIGKEWGLRVIEQVMEKKKALESE